MVEESWSANQGGGIMLDATKDPGLLGQPEKSLNFFHAGGLRPHPPLKSAAFAASEMMARSMGPGPGPWPWPIGPGSGPGPWALAWARCAGWLAG